MPVYLFALSQVPDIKISDSLLIFLVLHLLVYPSSNGYNSYMDRDQNSIGGIKNPLPPTRELLWVTVIMDIIAIALGCWISIWFALALSAYILASHAYSYRGIRLKKYPVAGFFTVIIFQGAVTFFMVYHGSSFSKTLQVPAMGMLASSLLIGSFYPITQVYQHEDDKKDGVISISYVLGYRGTFIFTALIYCFAMATLGYYFFKSGRQNNFFILATIMLPVLVYFFTWTLRVWSDRINANFKNTMRMNVLAAGCSSLAFMIILIQRFFE